MLELAWSRKGWAECTPIEVAENTFIALDERYQDVGLTTNEYDLIDENGILDLLGSRWHWDATIFPSFE
jgi:hypothetical protein